MWPKLLPAARAQDAYGRNRTVPAPWRRRWRDGRPTWPRVVTRPCTPGDGPTWRQFLAERHAILAAVPADPTAAIPAAKRELDSLRRRRGDLETGRGGYANHPLNRAVLDHEQAEANVARLRGNLDGRRLPRRERREKETELVQCRARLVASIRTVDDIRTPESNRIDRAETMLTTKLAALEEQHERRNAWFTSHPEAARRLDRIDRAVEALSAEVDGPARGRGGAGPHGRAAVDPEYPAPGPFARHRTRALNWAILGGLSCHCWALATI